MMAALGLLILAGGIIAIWAGWRNKKIGDFFAGASGQ